MYVAYTLNVLKPQPNLLFPRHVRFFLHLCHLFQYSFQTLIALTFVAVLVVTLAPELPCTAVTKCVDRAVITAMLTSSDVCLEITLQVPFPIL